MSDARATIAPSLVLSRIYDAPPERLYAAWTNPKAAANFMGPDKVKATEIEMDVRVGGNHSLVMVLEDGSRMPARGVYREVQPPKRLSMTWIWEEDDKSEEQETLLTLEFRERGKQTELILTHENLKSIESRDNHEEGWTAILDQLTTSL